MEPKVALSYTSAGGNGALGAGFSITGASAITRCPKSLADGEIRDVRYDVDDRLCLDGKPLVRVGSEPGRIDYRTEPDTFVKVIGLDPAGEGTPRSFEVFTPRGLVIEYGTSDGTIYSGGMALQSSLRLDAIQMVGPGDTLVRRYALTYSLSPTTSRTLLTQVEECAGDGVCKPPTRFQYQSRAAELRARATSIGAPTALKASPMLLDIDGDGLDDLVVPDTDGALSTPQDPITRWLVAHNEGASASPTYLGSPTLAFFQESGPIADPSGPADPAMIQPELGTALDYNDDGRMDVLLHDVHDVRHTWHVLLAQPDRTLKAHDTGIPRPFPLGAIPAPPTLTRKGGSMHLADVDGDRVPDLIQCEDHGTTADGDPSKPVWKAHLWRPAQGAAAAGFDSAGAAIEPLAEARCDTELHTQDINADGKVDLVVAWARLFNDGTAIPTTTYHALTRLSDGSWEVEDTELPIVGPGGRVVFLDVNGDGLPDAVQSGFGDHALRTFLNTGTTFAAMPVVSLGSVGIGDQDSYFRLAAPLDFNGDGRQDLLVPVPAGTLANHSNVLPAWAILQAKAGAQEGATFTLVDPQIPFEAAVGDAITLADPHGPRVGDLNGDGAADVVLPLGGVFHVLENLAPDQDLLVAISDGMNAHDPADPGVAGSAPGAGAARAVLNKFGIGINEASNGVFLPGAQHAALHTKEYYEAVTAALQGATTREQALNTLHSIGQALHAGKFP